MKRTIIVATFIITALAVCIPAQTPQQKPAKTERVKNEVTALASEYFKALVKADAAAMDRILSDDYVSIESFDQVGDIKSSGIPQNKDLILRLFKASAPNAPRLEAIRMDEYIQSVRVYGESAVLVAKITLKWQSAGEVPAGQRKFLPKNNDFIVTLVAVKKNGAWQVVSTHQSEFLMQVQATPTPN